MEKIFEMEDLRVRRTKKLIVQAFYRLLEREDFHKITIQQIADEAMINRQTFYLHYQDKYDLLQKIIDELCQEATAILAEQINELKQPILQTLQEHYDELIDSKDKIYLLLRHNYCSTVFRQTLRESFLTMLKKQKKLQLTDFEAKIIAINFMEVVMIVYTSEKLPSTQEIQHLYGLIRLVVYGKNKKE